MPLDFYQALLSLLKRYFLNSNEGTILGLIAYPLEKIDSKLDLRQVQVQRKLKRKLVNRVSFQIKKVLLTTKRHKANAEYLSSLLNSIENSFVNALDEPNHYIFPILIKNRDQLFNELIENNIELETLLKSLKWARVWLYYRRL